MTVSPVRPISAAEAALRVELAPQPGQVLRPAEVAPVVSPQASVSDHIALRTPSTPVADPAAPAPADATPEQAVKFAAQTAVVRQAGLAPLLADLAQAMATPGLAPTLKAAMAQVLAAQAPLGPAPSALAVRTAIANSGVFLEAHLAAILAPGPDGSPASGRDIARALGARLAPGLDAKATLLALRETLRTWLATQGPPAAEARPGSVRTPPAPPYLGGPVDGQGPASPTLSLDAPPAVVAQRLLQASDGALARQELLQFASIPDPGRPAGEGPRWMFELPLATPQGPAVAQFEVSRDGGGQGAQVQPTWRARFAVDVEPLGPVQAHVALKPGRTSVTLWAERDATAALLRDQGAKLSRTLSAADMVAEVAVYAGAPKGRPAETGQFVDQAS